MSGSPRSRTIRSGSLASCSSPALPLWRFEDFVALAGQAHAQQFADRRLVVDHQDPERGGAHAAVSNWLGCAGIGSLMVNAAPVRSVRLVAVIVPFMASTKPREIASPRPVPARTRSPFCAR